MKMTKREKQMAIVAGSLLTVTVLWSGGLWLTGTFGSSTKRLAAVNAEVLQLERLQARAMQAASGIAEYEKRSLSSKHGDARTVYQKWLLATAEKHFGNEITFVGPSESANRDIYRQFSYTVGGQGNIQYLTEFLFDFYSMDTLHRIRSMSVQSIDESKDLRITLVVEALSLPGAAESKELNTIASKNRLRYKDNDLDDYSDAILNRNLFAATNRQPSLLTISRQQATTGRRASIKVRATDPDLDKISYQLDEVPDGAKINTNEDGSAEISWTPPKAGTYSFKFLVSDDGLPQRTVEGSFEVVVSDPKPSASPVATQSKQKFDVAKATILIAVLQDGEGNPVIWLDEKPSMQSPHKWTIGKEFSIGSVTGVIRQIGSRDMTFESDGKLLRLEIGKTLADASEVPSNEHAAPHASD